LGIGGGGIGRMIRRPSNPVHKPDDGKFAQSQVTREMNAGNSVGPVVDVRGNVLGVVQARIAGTDINFAIPGEVVQEFIARKKN
jgi:S1-C subfamily serine protease